MASKKTFNIKDKVFAKIRGYPAWPAIVSGVKGGDTPSRVRYNVYFYGTGERAECKPEDLCPYQDNKSKLGKPNKRKFFTEALLEIEGDASMLNLPEMIPEMTKPNNTSTAPSNTSVANQALPTGTSENITKIDKKNESVSESEKKITTDELNVSKSKKVVAPRKSLGISISKGTKRRLSDVKSETSSKKSMPNKSKVIENVGKLKESQSPIVLVEALKVSVIERAQNKDKNIETTITNALTDETTDKHLESLNETVSKPNSNEKLLNNSTTKSIEVSLDNNKRKYSEVSLDNSKTKSREVSLENIKTTTSTEVSLDNGKTAKSASKTKDKNGSSSEISSGNVGHVSRSGRKIKPKKYSDYENDGEMSKKLRLSKENSKNTDKLNTSTIDIDSSLEQNCKSKDASLISETKIMSKTRTLSGHVNDTLPKDIQNVSNSIDEDAGIPAGLKGIMVDALSNIETGWKKTVPSKAVTIELLNTEVNLLDYIHKLRLALRIDHANYEKALESLDLMTKLHFNALMLIKHKEIVDTIKKVTKYVGNLQTWRLGKSEISQHTEKCTQIRRKADILLNKCVSLFTVPDGQTFQEVYNKEVQDFFTKTRNLSCDQIYGLTSDKYYK